MLPNLGQESGTHTSAALNTPTPRWGASHLPHPPQLRAGAKEYLLGPQTHDADRTFCPNRICLDSGQTAATGHTLPLNPRNVPAETEEPIFKRDLI